MRILDRLLGRKNSEEKIVELAITKPEKHCTDTRPVLKDDDVNKVGQFEIDDFEIGLRKMQELRHESINVLVTKGIWERDFAEYTENMLKVNEECMLVLQKCNTSKEIFDGFQKIIQILRKYDSNDPLIDVVEKTCKAMNNTTTDVHYRIKDDFIRDCGNFMSAGNEIIKKEIDEKLRMAY